MTVAPTARMLAVSGNPADRSRTSVASEGPTGRSRVQLIVMGCSALFCLMVLMGLGIWQLERRVWKLNLIQQVEQRVNAPEAEAPGPARWSSINAANDAYRHVWITGTYLHKPATLVKAVTARGPGFWVLSLFQSSEGFTVLVNRGFIPGDKAGEQWQPVAQATTKVSGLLRITEPDGGFLRSNDPAAGRWYSRDVAAIAKAQHIAGIAPYFIDADATSTGNGIPIGGLTVIAFANNHLVYALTWFAMAITLGAASSIIGLGEWRSGNNAVAQAGTIA